MPNTKSTPQNSPAPQEPGKSGERTCGKRKRVPVEGAADVGIVQESRVVAAILC